MIYDGDSVFRAMKNKVSRRGGGTGGFASGWKKRKATGKIKIACKQGLSWEFGKTSATKRDRRLRFVPGGDRKLGAGVVLQKNKKNRGGLSFFNWGPIGT